MAKLSSISNNVLHKKNYLLLGKLSNKGSECVLEILNRDKEEEEDQQDKNPSIISIGQVSATITILLAYRSLFSFISRFTFLSINIYLSSFTLKHLSRRGHWNLHSPLCLSSLSFFLSFISLSIYIFLSSNSSFLSVYLRHRYWNIHYLERKNVIYY